MVDVGGQFADRHLVGLDEQYIHQVAFDRNRPVFFGGSRNLDFIFTPICCGGYFSAASCRRNSKRLIRLLPLGSVRFYRCRSQILMPKSVWSGNISRTLIMLFFSFSQRPVLPVLILPLMAAALMFSAFWLNVGGDPFAKCNGGNGENQTELRQNQQQLFGTHAAGLITVSSLPEAS